MKPQKWIGGFLGMLKVSEILRLHEQGRNQTEIARCCSVSLHTVRDYIRKSEAAGISYESVEKLSEAELRERFGKRLGGRRVKSGTIDFETMERELSRKGVTLQLLWTEYLRKDPDGYSYSQYCHHYGHWLSKRRFSMRQDYKAGEKLFVDYAGLLFPIACRETGEIREIPIFVAAFGGSNYIFAEATSSHSLVHWIGSHVRAFEFYGGIPEVVIPDNPKTAVTDAWWYDPLLNRTYHELGVHYGIAIVPARSRRPRDKGVVENAVLQVERHILAPLRHEIIHSVEELNHTMVPLLLALNSKKMESYDASRHDLFLRLDKPALRPVPTLPYKFALWKTGRKVHIDYHIEVEGHYYSVNHALVGMRVDARISEHSIEILDNGKRVAIHRRSRVKGGHSTIKEHMPSSHRFMTEWNPERFISWAHDIGPHTEIQIQALLRRGDHPEQAYRGCLGVLSFEKKYGKIRLEAACERMNSLGVASSRSIRQVLQNGTDAVPSEASTTAPVRHSNLRGKGEFH